MLRSPLPSTVRTFSYPLPVCVCSQVVVSGPAGFVFHVEGLLADLRIPPEVVVVLD